MVLPGHVTGDEPETVGLEVARRITASRPSCRLLGAGEGIRTLAPLHGKQRVCHKRGREHASEALTGL